MHTSSLDRDGFSSSHSRQRTANLPTPFCVCVTFAVRQEAMPAFTDLVGKQARDSLTEPGCRVFDVWSDPARPGVIFLYEIYDSEAAFADHLKTKHFAAFDAATRDMVDKKTVTTWAKRNDQQSRPALTGSGSPKGCP